MTAPTDFLSRARKLLEEATEGPLDLPHLGDPSIACDCGHVFAGPEEIFVATIHEAGKGENAPEHAVAVANAAKFVLANNSFPLLLDVYEAAEALRHKMREVYADSRYMNVWATAQGRLGPYSGPDWIAEADALDAALAEVKP